MNWLILLGILLIAIGTATTYLGVDLKNKENKKQLKDSLETIQNQNTTLSNQINTYQKELKEKQDKIDELEKYAKKDLYKPLNSKIRRSIISQLQTVKDKIKEINIAVFDGNNNSKRVASDLIKLFEDANIKCNYAGTAISFNKTVSRPRFIMNENSKTIVEALVNILDPYIKSNFSANFDNKLENGVITFRVCGIPLFHEDGSIEFQ